MIVIRAFSVVALVTMAGAIAFGAVSGDFSKEGSEIVGLAWGKVTLIDLYVGLAIFGSWIAMRERSVFKVALWWAGLIFLGNFAAAAYLVWAAFRSSDLRELLLGRRAAPETIGRHETQ